MTNEPPLCGECDGGYIFEPPLQDGALGVCVPCEKCISIAHEFWRNYKESPDDRS